MVCSQFEISILLHVYPCHLEGGTWRCREDMTRRIALSIRGVNYETYEETLSRFPNTLLGNSALRSSHWDEDSEAYYFDRSQYLFDAILFFYQSGGIIAKPEYIDDGEFQEELRFFGIIKEKPVSDAMNNGNFEMKKFIRILTTYNASSSWSKSFALFSTITIILSTVTFCLETVFNDFYDANIYNKKSKIKKKNNFSGEFIGYFFICETFYMAWFSLEYILRILGHPKKTKYIFSMLGLVDLLAVVPYFVTVSNALSKYEVARRVVKLLHIFRILKLSRFSKSLQLLGKSLYYCRGQISLLLIFFFINCFACGSILYSVERSIDPMSSTSLMDTIWFCIVSMTTVGYGDIVPRTSLGKLMAAVTILVGIIVLFHIFIPVYLSYFALLYEISVLKTLDTSEDENDPGAQDEDEYKKHRRKSISSSVRKSFASVGKASNVCISETVTRKQSLLSITEETVMRRFKYEYLRKISSLESPLTTSQKSLATSDISSTFHFNKTSSDKLSVRINTDTEDTWGLEVQTDIAKESPDIKKRPKVKERRLAVYEEPIFLQNGYETFYTKSKVRSSSLSVPCSMVNDEQHRKLSLNDRIDQ